MPRRRRQQQVSYYRREHFRAVRDLLLIVLCMYDVFQLRKHSSQTFPPLLSLGSPARQAASTSYFPIVVALNSGYLFLRLVYQWSSVTVSRCVAAAILVALSYVSYKGILEDHANTIPKGKGSSNALAGGASLDLLGLVVVIQYGTVFVSEKLHWLFVLVPLWAGWNIYTTFFRSKA